MGVKSTITLSRQTAEDRYLELVIKDQIEHLKRSIRSGIALMDNETLENLLEKENDLANGGEGYENYIIATREE